MKKIAILTHPLTDNYGGILQAASLYNYLASHGHQVTLIRKHRPTKQLSLSTQAGRYLLENTPFQNHKGYRGNAKQLQLNERFIKDYIPGATRIIHTNNDVSDIVARHKFDVVIVGSDQVWRMKYARNDQFNSYFLDFPKPHGMRKIAYAASFGTDQWEAPDKVDEVRLLLQDFDAISVREVSGISICRDTFGIGDCSLTLDPTLLINADFFMSMMPRPITAGSNALLTYILDPNESTRSIVEGVRARLPSTSHLEHLINNGRPRSIQEWVGAFDCASYVVTDSFHGAVFSIIFRKPFVAIGNAARGMARFHSLLSLLDLNSRLVATQGDLDRAFGSPIDYDATWRRIEDLRAASELFLERSIS